MENKLDYLKKNFEGLGFYIGNSEAIDLKVFNIKNRDLLLYISDKKISTEKEARKELFNEMRKLYELYNVKRIKAYYITNDKIVPEFIFLENMFKDIQKRRTYYFKKNLESFFNEVKV